LITKLFRIHCRHLVFATGHELPDPVTSQLRLCHDPSNAVIATARAEHYDLAYSSSRTVAFAQQGD
jgi:hypothetical protein